MTEQPAQLTHLDDSGQARMVDVGEKPVTERRANDILRASGREPLPLNDPGVLHDLVKLALGKKLSPVLVVSFDDGAEIADGYHRVSLSYALDPFAAVPLRMASLNPR